MRRVGCTNHCATCGCHFHSLAAFDAHRVGDHASNDPELGRHCEHPIDVLDRNGESRYVVLAEHGFCDLKGEYQDDVCIRTLRASLENARRQWGEGREAERIEGAGGMSDYRLWVNEARTLLVRQWSTGKVEIAERGDPDMVWGPPIQTTTLPSWVDNLIEERVS